MKAPFPPQNEILFLILRLPFLLPKNPSQNERGDQAGLFTNITDRCCHVFSINYAFKFYFQF
jgi:hypothetical protein